MGKDPGHVCHVDLIVTGDIGAEYGGDIRQCVCVTDMGEKSGNIGHINFAVAGHISDMFHIFAIPTLTVNIIVSGGRKNSDDGVIAEYAALDVTAVLSAGGRDDGGCFIDVSSGRSG